MPGCSSICQRLEGEDLSEEEAAAGCAAIAALVYENGTPLQSVYVDGIPRLRFMMVTVLLLVRKQWRVGDPQFPYTVDVLQAT